MIFCLGGLMVEVVLVACPEALGFLRATLQLPKSLKRLKRSSDNRK